MFRLIWQIQKLPNVCDQWNTILSYLILPVHKEMLYGIQVKILVEEDSIVFMTLDYIHSLQKALTVCQGQT